MSIWHDLATRLKGMTVLELQRRMSSSEFVRWKVWIEEDWNRHTKEDYYLAQIAREVAAVLAKKQSSVKLKQFLLKFDISKPGPPSTPTPEEVKRRTILSKSYWLGFLGIKPEKEE